MANIDWQRLPHEMPKEMEPYLLFLCEAVDPNNTLKTLVRFQKVLRMIHDDVARGKLNCGARSE